MDTLDGLTKDDIAALRAADSAICFSFVRGSAEAFGGAGCGSIMASARVTPPKGFTGSSPADAQYTISCRARITLYEDAPKDAQAWSYVSAFVYCPVYRHEGSNSPLTTWIDFLRVGDVVSLNFAANTNGYGRNAGLYMDQLTAHVKRGKKTYAFLLEVSVCPNNTARMIQGL
jgi:hypothetical protein